MGAFKMRWIAGAIISATMAAGCSPGQPGDAQAIDEAMREICGAFRDGHSAPLEAEGWTIVSSLQGTSYAKFGNWGRVDVRIRAGNGPTRCMIDLMPASLETKPSSDAIYKVIAAVVAKRYPDARLDMDREEGAGRGGFLVTRWSVENSENIGFAEFPAQPFIPVVQVAWQWPV